MNQTHRAIEQDCWRDQRSQSEVQGLASQSSINQMENTMFEAMRKKGGYRVDYMNKENMGSPDALGFYVLGDLPAKQPYSHAAKHSLLAGLIMLQQLGEIEHLVGIYLDVNEGGNALRPAYLQMKKDLLAGTFRRLFVLDTCDLTGDSQTAQDWWVFIREVESLKVVSWGSGQLYEIPDKMLAQCNARIE